MKIKFTDEAKKFITVAELPEVNKIIREMREDDGLKDYARAAARIAIRDNCNEILKAEAEIARNKRIFNRYSDESGTLDVWITVYAFNDYKGFYTIGAYLSDIWELAGDNSEELRTHMYIREFIEKK